ncbi:MAG: T9SS type A sorting domain-containing protein [Bacteroidales bacterium]|nr:T9SS type A sorting domain-containing protein [Bacteroidales bacterium]
MKKLASLFCLLAFCAVSADGQSFQQPLEKVFHYMMPGHNVRHHAVQKSYTDSLLSAYTVMSRNNGLTTSMYYELQEGETFLLDEITYTYVKDGKVMETGTLSATGDTLDKTVYQYYNNSNEIHSTYEYFGGTDPELVTMEMYYGVKNIEISGLDDVNGLFGFTSAICDSMIIYEFDEEDTSVMAGYYTFDADGMPATFSMSVEYSGVLMDVIVKFVVENKFPVKATVTISAMGGMMTANVMEAIMSYNNKGQVLSSELIPLKNDLIDISQMIPRMKDVNTYLNDKLHCISSFGWVVRDSTHAGYVMYARDYYAYDVTTGEIDTIYHFEQYEEMAGDGIAANSRLQVSVSPNPVRDMLQISGLEQPAEVVFYSADGKKMMESRVEAGNSSLSLQTLPQGVYFVSIRNASGATVQKIVKQ